MGRRASVPNPGGNGDLHAALDRQHLLGLATDRARVLIMGGHPPAAVLERVCRDATSTQDLLELVFATHEAAAALKTNQHANTILNLTSVVLDMPVEGDPATDGDVLYDRLLKLEVPLPALRRSAG